MIKKITKDIPVIDNYDVVVVGAGPAGITAALSSAREGSRTVLIERYGVVGGNLTVGHVGPIMGSVAPGTMRDEIMKKLNVEGGGKLHDIEYSKIVLTNMLDDAGVNLILQTPVIDVTMDNKRINGVIIASKTGMEIIKGKIIIDATGDGTVSYFSGAEEMVGRDQDGLLQPVSIMFTISNVDKNESFVCKGERSPELEYIKLCRQKSKEGELPPNVTIVRLYRTNKKDERVVNATQANHINGLLHKDISKAELNLRNQVDQVFKFIKKYVPGCQNTYIKSSASTVGIRETRRIKGKYILRGGDLIKGRKFDDVVVHNAKFVIDIHNPDGGGQAEGLAEKTKSYDIPYRCFIPKKITNLMMAGRCISGTHRAHASYRVMGICMAMGQAVGISAAKCVEEDIAPCRINYKLIQEKLIDKGVKLFS